MPSDKYHDYQPKPKNESSPDEVDRREDVAELLDEANPPQPIGWVEARLCNCDGSWHVSIGDTGSYYVNERDMEEALVAERNKARAEFARDVIAHVHEYDYDWQICIESLVKKRENE